MSLSELLAVVYQFYPRGRWVDSPGYDETPERRRLVEATRRAAAEYAKWDAMLDRLRVQYRLQDRSLHLPGAVDSAYSAMLFLPGERDNGLGFHVSFLGPYYVVHRLGRPSEEPHALEIAREIEATYGHEVIPPSMGDVVVPDVTLDTVTMGEATIYDCLLSTSGGHGWMDSRGPGPRSGG